MQWTLLVALSSVPLLSGGPDAQTIIQRSVTANQRDWESAPEYSYIERDLKKNKSKTYRVVMLAGSPYQYLIKVNGESLSPGQREEQLRELKQAIQKRRNETAQQREKRIKRYRMERRRDHRMMEQLPDAFDFKLEGTQKLDGFSVYVISAEPRKGYRPPNTETEALTGMHGKLWIDKKTDQWVRVQAEVVHPVTVEGFLARIEPGTRFELGKKPVANGIWEPNHFSMTAKAKILFFIPHNEKETETYWDYRKGFSARDLFAQEAQNVHGGN